MKEIVELIKIFRKSSPSFKKMAAIDATQKITFINAFKLVVMTKRSFCYSYESFVIFAHLFENISLKSINR